MTLREEIWGEEVGKEGREDGNGQGSCVLICLSWVKKVPTFPISFIFFPFKFWKVLPTLRTRTTLNPRRVKYGEAKPGIRKEEESSSFQGGDCVSVSGYEEILPSQ